MAKHTRKIKFGRFSVAIPRSRIVRIGLGSMLTVFGIVGFLPIVGFWMVPLGLMMLSIDIPYIRLLKMKLSRRFR